MKNELIQKDLVLVKWDGGYTDNKEVINFDSDIKFINRFKDITKTVGFFVEEDDKVIVLASSIATVDFPQGMNQNERGKHLIIIPKSYVEEVTILNH